MPTVADTRARLHAAGAAEALAHAGLLPLVFERLPPGEQCVVVGRLSREWRAWAALRRQRLQQERRAQDRDVSPQSSWYQVRRADYAAYPLPLWAVQEAWPRCRSSKG
jgi:hypothetical protein